MRSSLPFGKDTQRKVTNNIAFNRSHSFVCCELSLLWEFQPFCFDQPTTPNCQQNRLRYSNTPVSAGVLAKLVHFVD